MPDAVIAQRGPYEVVIEADKSYFWCACGRSANQPFCDGSHKGTGFAPVHYVSQRLKTAYFCGCKQTGNRPLCDGSHGNL